MDLLKHFDIYSLQSRIFPSLIAGLPLFALLFALVPWDRLGLPHIVATIIGLAILFALADLGRRKGKHVQQKIGAGSTPEQWHRGHPDVPELTKNRYRDFMATKLNLAAPTADGETDDPRTANEFYLSANTWLRENTRDTRTFSLLFSENITYGYRRNILGLKYPALLTDMIAISISFYIFYFEPSYFQSSPLLWEKLGVVIVISILHSAYMLIGVTKAGVREASRAYGRQLILSCEHFINR